MRLLLDTHALLWAKASPARLTPEARDSIVDPNNEVFVSLVSAWELCVKAAAGRLSGRYDALIGSEPAFESQLAESGLELLAIAPSHVFETRRLPPHHRDPFDRLLIAQAIVEDLVIVTHDKSFRRYAVRILTT